MREDIVKFIAKQSDVTNIIVLTFNIDMLFVESVLIRALRKCGHPSLTIFADADEASRSFASQGAWVSGLGRRFRVVPILMARGYRFHPKAILLSGSKNATLLVGSGNLTFGGLRQNEEIWARYNTEADGTPAFASFREYLMGVVRRIQMPGVGAREVTEAYDGETHPWARHMAAPGGLLGRIGGERSLLEQVATELGTQKPDRIYVSSPFFDEAGAALATIARRWPEASVRLSCKPAEQRLRNMARQQQVQRLR